MYYFLINEGTQKSIPYLFKKANSSSSEAASRLDIDEINP
jgi:hypothetical protein